MKIGVPAQEPEMVFLRRMLLACEMTVVSNNRVGRSWCYSFCLCDDFRKNTPDLLIFGKKRGFTE